MVLAAPVVAEGLTSLGLFMTGRMLFSGVRLSGHEDRADVKLFHWS